MRRLLILTCLAVTVLAAPATAGARPATIAVFGDLPYSTAQIANVDNLSASVNADPAVSRAIHLGDIKSGSTQCTDERFQLVRDAFDRFADPLVYTPGDNEWTDCHRANNGAYLPVERLAKIRSMFFPRPGRTLGMRSAEVETQAAQDGYAQFVENVRWVQAKVVFAVANVPGSNNDKVAWTGLWSSPFYQAVQADEVATRTAATIDWIDQAFDEARETHAAGVVIGIQADLWDATTPLDQFTAFTPIVQSLAAHARRFGKPVLLLNGDSHHYGVDHPLVDTTNPFNQLYGITTPVANLTRLTVDGSTTTPSSWVRLTVDPSKGAGIFSFARVTVAF